MIILLLLKIGKLVICNPVNQELNINSDTQYNLNRIFNLSFRCKEGLHVIYISDIFSPGEKSREETWPFDMLKENIQNEVVSILKFTFLDFQVFHK